MTELQRGTILEQTFEIMEEIGSGGGGIVYRARHLRLQADVVVKRIKDEVRDKVKSRSEADILKHLKHPYLPRVYDFIETQDGVYTVMDYIQGENLDEAVKRRGKFSEKQVREWAKQLGSALAYLHSRKPAIIHSDIKPANIMLTQDGNVCLIDFNVSLAMGGSQESAVGISAGFSPPEQYRDLTLYERVTHSYTRQGFDASSAMERLKTEKLREDGTGSLRETMPLREAVSLRETMPLRKDGTASSPERGVSHYRQYIGRGIDERSDIYSLGMTFYCLLTGMEPEADFGAKIPMSQIRPDLSEGFAVLIAKMIEENPKERYQNGREFLRAVKSCHKLDGRYKAMRRWEAGLQLASLACLCAGVMLGIGGMYRIRQEKNVAYNGFLDQAAAAVDQYEFDEAEKLLEQAKEIETDRIDAYEDEVRLLYMSGDYEGCIDLGETYINTTPFLVKTEDDGAQLANLYYLTGNAYFELRDYANAAQFLENAIEQYQGNALYYRDYAIALAKMGQTKEAASVLETGIDEGLLHDSIYMAQGEISHVRGEYEEAAECLRKAIALTEDKQMQKRAVLLCTEVYQSMGSSALDEEIALLERYVDRFGEQGGLVMTEYLAGAYTRKARADEPHAEQHYEKAFTLFQSVCKQGYVTFQIQENMAIIQETLGRFDDAEKLLFEMAESYPKRHEPYKRLALLEADRQQEKEKADRNYQQMKLYYEQALSLYGEAEQDMEMDMLAVMMRELADGGWF